MLLIFGSINIDFIFPLSCLPRAGDTLWSASARTEPGGKGANAAIAAARDGAAVTLVGAVGTDVLADAALAGLTKAGVALSHIARLPEDTGRAAICIDPEGYSTVAVQAGANRLARASQVPDSLLGPRTTLLVQMETDPAETVALILRAKRLGSRVILHLSPARPIDTAALTAADVLIGSSPELAWAGERLGTGNNPASLSAALGVVTVRMMGVQGAESMSPDGFRHMPAFPIHMRDTTGAGDCFSGVLAAALARGAALDPAMRRASVAAALSATGLGAQRSMPHARDIDAALRTAPDVTDQQAELPD
ncbi:PfkB family carbohydrate kinase [Rhodopila sp.]|uniref:PfkB family carbohydrate kinase n=1 Tax=Rhodopila sp. TaxID=2480087 RepID=UPI003D11B6B1